MKATDMFSWLSGSEMGGRIRAFDWSQTPLGPIEQWPASLVSILGVCLTAQTPMAIYWGVDGWLLYNDAWRPVVGGKHPWALGHPAHEVWPELWPTIQHYFESVHTTGDFHSVGLAVFACHGRTRNQDTAQESQRHSFHSPPDQIQI